MIIYVPFEALYFTALVMEIVQWREYKFEDWFYLLWYFTDLISFDILWDFEGNNFSFDFSGCGLKSATFVRRRSTPDTAFSSSEMTTL